MLVGISPVRISFAGGGTDMPEYFMENEGNVVTTAINKFTYSIIQPRHDKSFQAFSPDFQKHYKPTSFNKIAIEDGTEIASSVIKYFKYKNGLNVILFSDVTAGSGLGASSSLAVNLVNTISHIKNQHWSKQKIAETSFHIGRKILHWPIGKQDEYISAFGGFNFIKFNKKRISVIPIKLKKHSQEKLEQNLLLFSLGYVRNNEKILTGQIDRIKQKNSTTMDSLDYVKDLAIQMHSSLKKNDLTSFGSLLHDGWMTKKKFTIGISNPQIDKIYQKALDTGAIGGKITGAGGGGHMLFYCELSKQKNVINEMSKIGLRHIPFNFYFNGPHVFNPSLQK